jgi:hypothetical protein
LGSSQGGSLGRRQPQVRDGSFPVCPQPSVHTANQKPYALAQLQAGVGAVGEDGAGSSRLPDLGPTHFPRRAQRRRAARPGSRHPASKRAFPP